MEFSLVPQHYTFTYSTCQDFSTMNTPAILNKIAMPQHPVAAGNSPAQDAGSLKRTASSDAAQNSNKKIKTEAVEPKDEDEDTGSAYHEQYPPAQYLLLQIMYDAGDGAGTRTMLVPLKKRNQYGGNVVGALQKLVSREMRSVAPDNIRLTYDGEALMGKTPAQLANDTLDGIVYFDQVDAWVSQTGGM